MIHRLSSRKLRTIGYVVAGLLTCPVFRSLPIRSLHSGQWQVIRNTDRLTDRASQQRVLLRIQTVFPFHCIKLCNTKTLQI